MNIVEATQRYERWVEQQLALENVTLDDPALRVKHDEMAKAPFAFLRATFYRWAQIWPKGKHAWQEAPELLSVGDLHVENFGTWRDAEGRLVWGVNDFDEACRLPYTNDLVRLATSARLAIADNHYLAIGFSAACGHLLAGYEETLRAGKEAAAPLVLSEDNDWLRDVAAAQVRDPAKFWDKLDHASSKGKDMGVEAAAGKKRKTPLATRGTSLTDGAMGISVGDMPRSGHAAISAQLPSGFRVAQWKRRQAGLGSLGRPRFVALGTWQGGRLAREGKALVPSATFWARSRPAAAFFVDEIIAGAVRCPDPQFYVQGCWLVRRLAPDCTKLELFEVPKRHEAQLLFAMGREIANVHLGTTEAIPAVLKHLKKLPKEWLEEAAQERAARVLKDWEVWRDHHSLAADEK